MTTKEYKIEGMSCQHCVESVKKGLEKFDLENYTVEIGKVSLTYNEETIDEQNIKNAFEKVGFKVLEK